jgi:hypothetical protein
MLMYHVTIAAPIVEINGKSYIFPSNMVILLELRGISITLNYVICNQATAAEAAELCLKRGMALVSLESKEEIERITEYMEIKRDKSSGKDKMKIKYFLLFTDHASFLTSLSKVGDKDFKWLGKYAANFVDWAPGQPTSSLKCGALDSSGISMVSCDSASNFICEKERCAQIFLKINSN